MGNSEINGNGKKTKIPLHWSFFIMIFGVLALSIVAFFSPISQCEPPAVTPSEVAMAETGSSTPEFQGTPVPTETLPPPTPDEIGYSNGIIFWSTILILILLIGTLREILYARKKSEEDVPHEEPQ